MIEHLPGEELVEFKVKSLSQPETFYSVVATRDGRAVSCTCPAGTHSTPCKHIYRVTAKKAFGEALNALVQEGLYFSSEAEIRRVFSSLLAEKKSVEEAMAAMIQLAFPKHPLAQFRRWTTAPHLLL